MLSASLQRCKWLLKEISNLTNTGPIKATYPRLSKAQVTDSNEYSTTPITVSFRPITSKLTSLRRGEVGQIIQSHITLAEKVSRLKQIEEAEYQPLMKQLAYTRRLRN